MKYFLHKMSQKLVKSSNVDTATRTTSHVNTIMAVITTIVMIMIIML